MPSADIAKAAEVAVTARCQNNGQSCIAAKRFIVHTDVYDEFAEEFAEAHAGARPSATRSTTPPTSARSPPSRGATTSRSSSRTRVDKGATVVVGGERPDGPGWFYPPTLLTGITEDMRMYREEVFGPVAALFTASPTSTRRSQVANDTTFGLGANAWTNDPQEQEPGSSATSTPARRSSTA